MERQLVFKKLRIVFLGMFLISVISACGKSAFTDSSVQTESDKVTQDIGSSDVIIEPAMPTDEDPRFEGADPVKPEPIKYEPIKPQPVNPQPVKPSPVPPKQVHAYHQVKIATETRIRTLKENVLEHIYTLNPGDVIEIDQNLQPVSYNYRDDQGKLAFASTGFYPSVKIIKTALSEVDLKKMNETATGLYVTSIVVSNSISEVSGTFSPLISKRPSEGYLKFYDEKGKPKNVYTKKATERFPGINKGVLWLSLSSEEQKKWSSIMAELQKVADRTRPSAKNLLMIAQDKAEIFSLEYEKQGLTQGFGAWSVAVQGTARRNGFEDVPCAEFMGEVIRQAYHRAGYKHQDDFNEKNGNILDYNHGASAVVNLSAYLAKAGWVAWDAQIYAPSLGAVMMHQYGISPGHTYMAAGSNGRFIIDNGSPQGRDLRGSTERDIGMMYQTGLFFLPPGFTPQMWSEVTVY